MDLEYVVKLDDNGVEVDENVDDHADHDTIEYQKDWREIMMQAVPMQGLATHKYYDDSFEMYVVVGQSSVLKFLMTEHLQKEISRGLWIFMISLMGGAFLCFVIFSIWFERHLQHKVTKPISDLSMQIKNPKEFMASRIKSLEIYGIQPIQR